MPTNEERREVVQRLRELAADKFDLLPSECVMVEISKTIGDPDGWNSLTVLADLIEHGTEKTCIPVVRNGKFEDLYFVECSECKGSFGGMFFEKEKAEAFARSLPTYYLKYCQKCGAKVVKA